ncbi:MAG: hypothetical protein JO062_28225 [Bryobacterales bacterium]|nr:hypothetical protein [Bryobacterales bacterium]
MFTKKSFAVTFTALAAFALTFVLAAQDKKPEWKDRAEFDLYDSAVKDQNPTSRLEKLDKWKQQYPSSDFAEGRKDMILTTYQQLNQQRQVIDTAQDILKDKPNNFHALSAILAAVQALKPPAPADLDLAEKTATYLFNNIDAVYAPTNKPEGVKDDDWAKAKTQSKPYAVATLKWVIDQRKDQSKDNARAEADLTKLLKMDPTEGAVSYDLAGTILAQAKQKPEEQPLALYDYARAAAYDGPNALSAQDRTQVKAYLQKVYPQYHGSNEGLDQLLALAKNDAFPPADFKIKSTADIAQEQAAKEAEEAAKNPMLTLWVKTLRENLTKPDGDAFFEMNVKGTLLPGGANGVSKFKGKIVSMTPAARPKEVNLAIEKAGVPDAKLMFETALPGKMEPGEELEFEGTAKSFTKEPFSITFDVEKDQLTGWTGKNAAPAAKKGTAAAKKKQ